MNNGHYMESILPRERLARYIMETAGSIMLVSFHTHIKTDAKDTNDYVTEVDTRIEEYARQTVIGSFPDDSFSGEEGTVVAGNSGFEWVIDPIDGTNNYVRGMPFAGVQLAILHEGAVVFGIVYRPFTQDIYSASKGKGAFYENRLTGEKRRIRVSERAMDTSIGIFDDKVGKTENKSTPIFNKLADKIVKARVYGTAVYDIPAVAEGSVEFLVTGIAKRYDVAPGWLLVEEAGGAVFGVSSDVSVDDGLVIFSNAKIKDDLLGVIRG